MIFFYIPSSYTKIWGGEKMSPSGVSPKSVKSKMRRRRKKKKKKEKKKSRWKQWPTSLHPPPRVAHASTPGPKKEKVDENNGQLRFVRHHVWRTQARLDQLLALTNVGEGKGQLRIKSLKLCNFIYFIFIFIFGWSKYTWQDLSCLALSEREKCSWRQTKVKLC